jgi:hypothetical protein
MAKDKPTAAAPSPEDRPEKPRENITSADAAAAVVRARPLQRYRIEIDGERTELEAVNFREAWAALCDRRKRWPSIKYAGVRIAEQQAGGEWAQVYPAPRVAALALAK